MGWGRRSPSEGQCYSELVSEKPDVIVANSTLSLAAVRNETSTIPIVFVVVGDPIGQGFVSSFAHPGGNITGFTSFEFATAAKWLELIKEIAPELGRIAFIFHPEAGPYAEKFVQSIEPLAHSLGGRLMVTPTRPSSHRLPQGLGPRQSHWRLQQGFTTGGMGRTVILRGSKAQDQMSALGQKRTFLGGLRDVRFVPEADKV